VAAGTTDVTVRALGVSQSFSVTVVAAPSFTLTFSSAPAGEVGDTLTASVTSNATLAHDYTFAVASSSAAVASAPVTLRLGIDDGEATPSSDFGIKALTAGTSTITVTGGSVPLTQLVTIAP
jgi:hypothetical protein